MLRARVIGNVWATKRLPEIPNGAFLEVEVEPGEAHLIAFDVLGSGVGEAVLVATGSVAAARSIAARSSAARSSAAAPHRPRAAGWPRPGPPRPGDRRGG